MMNFCFKRLTFIHQLLWLTFFLWIMLMRLNIFRVLDLLRTSYFLHRTFIRLILGQLMLYIIMILLRLMVQNRSWRNVILGMELSWLLIFLSLNLIIQGILNNRLLLTLLLRLSDLNLHKLGWLILRFWNRYHIMLHYQLPYIHQHFRLINGLIRLRYKVQQRYLILLVMVQFRKFP